MKRGIKRKGVFPSLGRKKMARCNRLPGWLSIMSSIGPPCFLNFRVFSIFSIPIRSDRLLRSTSPVWSWSEAEELPGLLPVTLAQQGEKFLTESGLEAMPLDYNQAAKVPHSAFIDFPELKNWRISHSTHFLALRLFPQDFPGVPSAPG